MAPKYGKRLYGDSHFVLLVLGGGNNEMRRLMSLMPVPYIFTSSVGGRALVTYHR